MTRAAEKTTVRLDTLAHIAKAVKPTQSAVPQGSAFASNRRQRTETGAGRPSSFQSSGRGS